MALKQREREKVSTLRFLISALKNKAIEKKLEKSKFLPDDEVIRIIKTQLKQIKESIEEFEKGERLELKKQHEREAEILRQYLPEEMSEREIEAIIRKQIEQFGKAAVGDLGKVMGAVMKEVGDRADGARVREMVQRILLGAR